MPEYAEGGIVEGDAASGIISAQLSGCSYISEAVAKRYGSDLLKRINSCPELNEES